MQISYDGVCIDPRYALTACIKKKMFNSANVMAQPHSLPSRRAIYCGNRNGATLQTLFSGPCISSGVSRISAVVGAGLVTTRLALSFVWHAKKLGPPLWTMAARHHEWPL
jgi:hypothetical protein